MAIRRARGVLYLDLKNTETVQIVRVLRNAWH